MARADVGQLPLDELHQKTWTTREGIPHNTINAIAQTPDGYLWFATWEGVARFNGHEFRIFERSPETGLPDSGLLSLNLSSDGRLLVAGARGGMSLREGQSWTGLRPAPAMIFHALIATDGSVWMATQGAGVIQRTFRDDGTVGKERRFLPSGNATDLVEDDAGRIWVASSQGLMVIEDGEAEKRDEQHGLPPGPVYALLIDDDGRMMVGTDDGVFLERNGQFYELSEDLSDTAISALLIDNDQALWVGTVNSGLARINDEGIAWLGTEDGLPNNRVLALHQDLEGSLWVGTDAGLFRLRAAPFVTHTRKQGLAGNYVRAVMPRADGSLWVGTSEGVSRVHGKVIDPVMAGNEPFELSVLSLAETASGDVLIGTHANGVERWRDGRIVARHRRAEGLPSNNIRIMTEDRQGRIWIGTANGLARIDDGTVRVFTPEDGLPGDFVISLHEDKRGNMWVGTGAGLAKVSGEQVEAFSLRHLDDAMYAYDIHEDAHNGVLWLATDRGLVRFGLDGKQSAIIGRSAGMPIDKYFHVVEDRQGGFWLTSNRGILHIQKADAQAVADGELERLRFELYTEGDGLISAQANGGSGPPAAFHDGRVWIATAAGLASVDPDHLSRYEETTVPVNIERFEVDGRARSFDSRAELSAETGRIAIRYAGLGFIMPERIRYRTWLKGYDPGWVERGHQNIAEYTNLAPGDYTFRVSASYPYGPWSNDEARLEFSIAPMLWQRPGFWIVLVAATIALLYALIRLRIRQLELRALTLRAQVEEKTRELQQQSAYFERQARIDQLTGLANRRAFDEWLAREFNNSKRHHQTLSLAVLDLDHFKQVNDDYTHLVGDEVMKIIANVLKEHIREGDQAARWGGEEFTLTFRQSDAAETFDVCERIRQTIEQIDFGDIAPGLRITASFGISDSEQADSYQALLQQADHALYRAKKEGRNLVVTYKSSLERA